MTHQIVSCKLLSSNYMATYCILETPRFYRSNHGKISPSVRPLSQGRGGNFRLVGWKLAPSLSCRDWFIRDERRTETIRLHCFYGYSCPKGPWCSECPLSCFSVDPRYSSVRMAVGLSGGPRPTPCNRLVREKLPYPGLCIVQNGPGSYQVPAAINSVHGRGRLAGNRLKATPTIVGAAIGKPTESRDGTQLCPGECREPGSE